MKRVLILAYDFPPYNSIAAMRPSGWVKYLHQFGWYPVVITRHWDPDIKNPVDYIKPSSLQEVTVEETGNYTIIRLPYNPNLRDRLILKKGMNRWVAVRKMLTAITTVAKYLTFAGDNTKNIYTYADRWLSENRCEAVIATGEPFWLFRYAALLSRKHKVPWIADYRDGWTTDPKNIYFSGIEQWFINHFFALAEKHYVSTAHLIMTASHPYSHALQPLFPEKKIMTVVNGYDEMLFEGLPAIQQSTEKFIIAYGGRLYEFQPVEIFLEGFRRFLKRTGATDVEVRFYGGAFYPEQEKRVFEYDKSLHPYLKSFPRLAHREALEKLSEANLLLLLASPKVEKLLAKIFDYLALNRKILMVRDDRGILRQLMTECNGGVICDTAEEVADALQAAYGEFRKYGRVNHQSLNYQKYSRKNSARKLADLLNTLVKNPQGSPAKLPEYRNK